MLTRPSKRTIHGPLSTSADQKPKRRPVEAFISTSTDTTPLPDVELLRVRANCGNRNSYSEESHPLYVLSEAAWAARLIDEHFQGRPLPIVEKESMNAGVPSTMDGTNKSRPVHSHHFSIESFFSAKHGRGMSLRQSKSTYLLRADSLSDLYHSGRSRVRSFVGQFNNRDRSQNRRSFTEPLRHRIRGHFPSIAEKMSRFNSTQMSDSDLTSLTNGPTSDGIQFDVDNPLRHSEKMPRLYAGDHESSTPQCQPTAAATPSQTTADSLQNLPTTTASSPTRACLHEHYTHTECQCSVTRIVYCSCPVSGACLETTLDDRRGLTILTEMKYFLNPICHDCLMLEIS